MFPIPGTGTGGMRGMELLEQVAQSFAQALAGLEMRHVARPQHDVVAGTGVAGHARPALAQAETAEAAQLPPVVLRQALGDVIEDQLDRFVHVARSENALADRLANWALDRTSPDALQPF